MVSSLDQPPTQSVVINNLTVSLIDNMFIVNPPKEVKQAVEEQANDLDQDQGVLDFDFLEFNELEKDIDDYTDENYDARGSRLDIDFLDVDFLTDLLDIVEELEKTTASLGDRQKGKTGEYDLKGATLGFNKDSQFNIFVEDGDLYLYRNVNGVIEIIVASGGSGFIDTRVEGWEGIIEFGNGDPSIRIFINQSN